MSQCEAITKKGTQCSRRHVGDTLYCWQHQNHVVHNVGQQSPAIPPPTANSIPFTSYTNGSFANNSHSVPLIIPPQISTQAVATLIHSPKVAPPVATAISPPKITHLISSPPKLLLDVSISLKEVKQGLISRHLSSQGSDNQLRYRLAESLRRGHQPYIDILGQKVQNKTEGFYVYGEEIKNSKPDNILIMGEGVLQIERQSYDSPVLKLKPQMLVKHKVVPITEDNLKLETKCNGVYLIDAITQEDLNTLDPQNVYVDSERRCYYIPSILAAWEQGFSFYDPQSTRVVPVYPKDIHGEYLDPIIITSVYHTAVSRNLDLKEYPLLTFLVNSSDFLLDVDRFIKEYDNLIDQYDNLIDQYDKLHKLYTQDGGLWNRRDLLAYDLLCRIYERYNIKFHGARKYTDVMSGPGRNGTQNFYQALLIAFFLACNCGIVFVTDEGLPTNIKWVVGVKSEQYANPVFNVDRRGHRTIEDYKMYDLLRTFVRSALPL